jgi:anti-anti-sigma factor
MGNAHPTVITLAGEWDIYRRNELRDVFAAAYDCVYVIFDFSAVTYADSTVLSELVRLRRYRLEKNLPMFAVVASKTFERVLTITHLDQFWPCFANLGDAIASFDGVEATG